MIYLERPIDPLGKRVSSQPTVGTGRGEYRECESYSSDNQRVKIRRGISPLVNQLQTAHRPANIYLYPKRITV